MTAITKFSVGSGPISKLNSGRYDGKTVALAAVQAILVFQFDLWREGYGGAVVQVFKEGTTDYADLYSDVNLSVPIDNPQVLLTNTANNRTYGKFTQSVYTPDSYYLVIDGVETTGVEYQPIRSLYGQDASDAYVTSGNGGIQRTLRERAAYSINVLDFGNFSQVDGSSDENTDTLAAAIGAASSANGGRVFIPAGRYRVNAFSLPADVILVGQGRDATFIQSTATGTICTVTGDHAGLEDLCLDGVLLTPTSVGLYALNRTTLHLTDVTIKRFDTGIRVVGGTDHDYRNLYVDNCLTNVWLRGDTDANSTALGGALTGMAWNGGAITQSLIYGLRLSYIDANIQSLTFRDVEVTDNVGTALSIEGAKALIFEDFIFARNTVRHILTQDVAGATTTTFENAEFRSCQFTDSEIKLGGACKDVIFDRSTMSGSLSLNANGPSYPIMFRDSAETSTVTQTGNTDQISRWTSINNGVFKGQTTASVTTAIVYKRVLAPGELVHLEVIASGVHTSIAAQGSIKKTAAVFCPAAQLSFVGQTVSFSAGNTVSVASSGASAVIQSQTDAGASGTLNLIRVNGTFANNDTLVGAPAGNGTVQGVIALQNATTIAPVQTDHFALPAGATTWDVDVTTSGQEARVIVRGVTTGTIDWRVLVRANSAV